MICPNTPDQTRERFRCGHRGRYIAAITVAAFLVAISGQAATSQNAAPLKPVAASASSEEPGGSAALAIDTKTSDDSRWISAPGLPASIEVRLASVSRLGGLHLISGFGKKDAIEQFSVEFWADGLWQEIPSASVANNTMTALALPFDTTVNVTTDRIRIRVTKSPKNIARIKEIVIWPYEIGDLPPVKATAAEPKNSMSQSNIVPLYLNQSGFNLGKPKRFTAPTLPDGTSFVVRLAGGGPAVAQGMIQKNIGDFSDFNPVGSANYVVEAGGLVSVPFRVGPWWLERVTYQNAVNFMIDSRHYVGNDRAVCRGSFGWRDDHHFGWELHSLVPQWLSNPSAYERMPRQIRYEPSEDPRLWGKLAPYRDDIPDVVKLIHWGADVIVTQGATHEMMKAQLAYFLYAWPALRNYLPEQNYTVVRDFAFAEWAKTTADQKYPYDESPSQNLLALKTKIGSTKGSYPPGFSIQPNLIMHQVALREKRADADVYLAAAKAQAEWMIAQLDWNNPQVTKGQRMSEFITVTGLAFFLSEFPDQAPAGLAEKINDWARVIVRRSDNLWDFRKLDDGDKWTPTGEKPTQWNEPGNVVGLPAAIFAAQPFIKDAALNARLEEIAWAHFDDMFGRNPVGRHFSYDAPREIEGVEYGWFKFHAGGIGRLADARFVIDGSPKDGHYPYHSEKGDMGWTEGWIQFNTPFNTSLAYLASRDSKVELVRQGDELVVRLTAPLNFDYDKAETGSVSVRSAIGDEETVLVTEDSTSSPTLTGRIKLQSARVPRSRDGVLQAAEGSVITASYGFGYLGHQTTLKP